MFASLNAFSFNEFCERSRSCLAGQRWLSVGRRAWIRRAGHGQIYKGHTGMTDIVRALEYRCRDRFPMLVINVIIQHCTGMEVTGTSEEWKCVCWIHTWVGKMSWDSHWFGKIYAGFLRKWKCIATAKKYPSVSPSFQPHAGSRFVRIDTLCCLAGCRKRWLNQVLSIFLLVLLFTRATSCIVSFFRWHVFCLLVVLVKLSLLAKWLARKTPLRKPNSGEGIVYSELWPKHV